ncbi:MAG: hypothetical protein JW947_00435 [Sedimentisphaerales bacterium]|nr:hypothetical protein [Sedimentisphaerales bacterium]
MKRLIVLISMTTIVCCGLCSAGASVVKNGGFENDGRIDYVTQSDRCEYWCGVSYDSSKFIEYVYSDWATSGNYSLTLYSYMYTTFTQDDSATITQSVYLDNAEQITFDIFLWADGGGWQTSLVTASVLIDNTEIWNSDSLTYPNGIFMGNIAIDINETFKDSRPHLLTLRLKADTSSYHIYAYSAQWDSIGLVTTCGAGGYLPADFTHDCRVDINDLAVLAEGWLDSNGPDLTGDGDVNFADFAVMGNSWMEDNSGEPFIPGPDFLFLDADFNDDGIVDYADVVVLSNNWLGQGGYCVREDLNDDDFVDFMDLALLAEQWREIGDLYGL